MIEVVFVGVQISITVPGDSAEDALSALAAELDVNRAGLSIDMASSVYDVYSGNRRVSHGFTRDLSARCGVDAKF